MINFWNQFDEWNLSKERMQNNSFESFEFVPCPHLQCIYYSIIRNLLYCLLWAIWREEYNARSDVARLVEGRLVSGDLIKG